LEVTAVAAVCSSDWFGAAATLLFRPFKRLSDDRPIALTIELLQVGNDLLHILSV
jgi:hypothetical protein